MWISEPTPVISSTKHIDKGSTNSPKFTCRPPAGTHANPSTCRSPTSPERPSMSASNATPTANAATTVAHPRRWPQRSLRRPASRSTAAPNAGSASSSHTSCVISVLQQACFVDRGRPAGAENRHDDGQADDHLAGGHHHREERHHLTVELAVHACERDEREIASVQHQLDTHEHHDRVAPQQHSHGTDREQQRRQIQVVERTHARPFPLRASGSSASFPLMSTGRGVSTFDTDSSEYEPSGNSAGTSTALWRGKKPGVGQGGGGGAGGDRGG